MTDSQHRASAGSDRRSAVWLAVIAPMSLLLNLWGSDFGLPERWHPDEITGRAVAMARELSLDPHEFRYGSLHFYLVLAVIVPTYLVAKAFGLGADAQASLVVLAARSLSALLGAGCVALTFLLARRLFDRATAILSASFLALSMGLVVNAHFATVDVPMVFWMTASFLMSAEVLLSGRRRAYVLAGAFAGLAGATKYPGVLAVLCLPLAHLLAAGPRDRRALLSGLLAAVLAFIVANPPLFLASCQFLEGVIRDNAYSSTQGDHGSIPLAVLANLRRGFGSPLFVLVCLSLIYASLLSFKAETRPKILLLAGMVVPSALLLVSLNANYLRFVIPLFPPLVVLAGKAAADLIGTGRPLLRRGGIALAAGVIALSGLRSVIADLTMTHDARELAIEWVERNVPPGATIEVTPGVGMPDGERFQVARRPFVNDARFDSWIEELPESAIYRILQPVYLAYEAFAEGIGLCPALPYHYRGWYDREQAKQLRVLETFDQSLEGLESRAPDILIVSQFYYYRYRKDQTSAEGRLFADLFAGRTSYRQVAEIQYQALPWPDPVIDFINPRIWIFEQGVAEPRSSRARRYTGQPSRSPRRQSHPRPLARAWRSGAR